MIGFICTGNMGGALAAAVAKSGMPVMLSDASAARAMALAKSLGARITENAALAERSDMLYLGVKPQTLPALLEEIRPQLCHRDASFVLVSMAAGISIERIKTMCGKPELPIIRIMPNLPVCIGAGTILYCASPEVTPAQLTLFQNAMRAAGSLHLLDERLIDAGSAVTGCGPAFVALMIEAMADGAVACGIPRKDALAFAESMTAGTAKLLLEQQKQPGQFKDEVCSPGGTTIQGVRALEAGGVRSAFFEAVVAACEANKKL